MASFITTFELTVPIISLSKDVKDKVSKSDIDNNAKQALPQHVFTSHNALSIARTSICYIGFIHISKLPCFEMSE